MLNKIELNEKLQEYEKLWNLAIDEFPFIIKTLEKTLNSCTSHNPLKKDYEDSIQYLRNFIEELRKVW